MSSVEELEAACSLLAELEWVTELLRRDRSVPDGARLVLFSAVDAPGGLGRFAPAVRLQDIDTLLRLLATPGTSRLALAEAEAIVDVLRPALEASLEELDPVEREGLLQACRHRPSVLDQLGAEPALSREKWVQIDFVLQRSPSVSSADLASALADQAEASLGAAGDVVGYEWHSGHGLITILVEGQDAVGLTEAVLPLIRPHAGPGSYYELRRDGENATRHSL